MHRGLIWVLLVALIAIAVGVRLFHWQGINLGDGTHGFVTPGGHAR